MATVTKVYSSRNVLQSPADVFLGVPPPTSHVPPTAADEIAIDTSGQPATQTAALLTATNATPIVVTFTNLVGYTPYNGDIIVVSGGLVNTSVNGTWTLESVTVGGSVTTATLLGSKGNGVYTASSAIAKWGQHLGLTEGPTQFSVTQTAVEIRADQYEAAIDAALTKVEAELDIVMMEFDALRMQRYFSDDYGTNAQKLANVDVFTMGGQLSCNDNIRSLMLVSADRGNIGQWIYVYAPRVYLKSAIQLQFHRTAHSKYSLKFGVLGDSSREFGDELCEMVRTTSV